MKKVKCVVEVTIDETKYSPINDGLGALADIIRDGLNNDEYDYIEDIKILDGRK